MERVEEGGRGEGEAAELVHGGVSSEFEVSVVSTEYKLLPATHEELKEPLIDRG